MTYKNRQDEPTRMMFKLDCYAYDPFQKSLAGRFMSKALILLKIPSIISMCNFFNVFIHMKVMFPSHILVQLHPIKNELDKD